MSEKFIGNAVDDNGDGLDVERVVQVRSGSASGMVTAESEIFRLGNLEYEVKLLMYWSATIRTFSDIVRYCNQLQ